MAKTIRKENPFLSLANSMFIDLPSPSSLSYLWNFGSLLGVCLIIQTLLGIFLAMHYCAEAGSAFELVTFLLWDVDRGFWLRYLHINGAFMFFLCVYVHIGRSVYYGSDRKQIVWGVGVGLYILMMGAAFMGYVLPWGQMSFWAATVITNLLSVVPYIGDEIVRWVWGGFGVGNATLNRFFSLHYLFPFILVGLALGHLIALHERGSSNSIGARSDVDKMSFHYFYVVKDLLGGGTLLIVLFFLVFLFSYVLGGSDNFRQANSLETPAHIQPEWYFLFAYAILRSVPNKWGGVVALAASLLVLFWLAFRDKSWLRGLVFSGRNKNLFWFLVVVFWLLTWIGGQSAEEPYITVGQYASIYYFLFFIFYFFFLAF